MNAPITDDVILAALARETARDVASIVARVQDWDAGRLHTLALACLTRAGNMTAAHCVLREVKARPRALRDHGGVILSVPMESKP